MPRQNTTLREFLSNLHFQNDWWEFTLPCVMIGIDFATGLIYAWASKTFRNWTDHWRDQVQELLDAD